MHHSDSDIARNTVQEPSIDSTDSDHLHSFTKACRNLPHAIKTCVEGELILSDKSEDKAKQPIESVPSDTETSNDKGAHIF